MGNTDFRIGAHTVGTGRCFIIGEIAQAHDGSLGMAHAYIDTMARAGADAVKFQTHIADAESSPLEPWRIKFSPQDATRFDYWKRMEFTPEQWAGLKQHADESGLVFLSSPFSMEAAELLDAMGMAAWKVASGEISNGVLVERMASTGRPVLLSSGMSPLAELDIAVDLVRSRSAPFAVMQCTSNYPTPPEKLGLNLLGEFRSRYGCPTGLSDHSGQIFAGLAAAALGSDLLEIHVTMSREMFGPDVIASVTSGEFRQMIEGIRFIETALANPIDKDSTSVNFEASRAIFMKSVFAGGDIAPGTVLTTGHLRLKKPGTGIPAARVGELVGRVARRPIAGGDLIAWGDLE